MLLAIDIGNTNITCGVFGGGKRVSARPKTFWRIETDRKRKSGHYRRLFSRAFKRQGVKPAGLSAIYVCSVVPGLDGAIAPALKGLTGIRPVFVGKDVSPPIRIKVDKPGEVGADRVVNAVAALRLHKPPLIVVDLGTASTFDYISKDGSYRGGVIAPGIGISAEALFEKTAKLPRIKPGRAERVIGTDTVSAMKSGLYWGFVSLVDGVIEKMKGEIKGNPAVIATGGFSSLVKGASRFIATTDEFLTLKGLNFIYEGERR